MRRRRTNKLIHEGDYVADVEVELIDEGDTGWSPYLSLEEAQRLDRIRTALRKKDLKTASQMARIYRLTPVAV